MSGLHLAGTILTQDPARPQVETLRIADGRVTETGPEASCREEDERWVLPAGAVALPGFVDPHVHLLAAAARRLSVDCSPLRAPSIDALVEVLAAAAAALPPGTWIRAHGYDDAFLAERRDPDRAHLDRASTEHPILLHHAAGHMVVGNSLALELLGVEAASVPAGHDPVVRDPSGAPTGPLVGAHELLARRVPPLEAADLRRALAAVGRELSRAGVVSVCDTTVTNGIGEVELLGRLREDGTLPQQLTVLPGVSRLDELRDAGIGYRWEDHRLAVGHAKLYVTDEDDAGSVGASVTHARDRGWPVAAHVLDVGPLDAVLRAVESEPPAAGTRDRLEHVALALPEHAERIAGAGAAVVTQPAFIPRRGAKYLRELGRVEREWLYPAGSLRRLGVLVAASSDAPVVPPRPLEALEAAVRRRCGEEVIGAGERVGVGDALAMVTRDAAHAAGMRGGVLRPGAPGDLVVLSRDPRVVPPEELSRIEVLATVIAGAPVFGGPEALRRESTG